MVVKPETMCVWSAKAPEVSLKDKSQPAIGFNLRPLLKCTTQLSRDLSSDFPRILQRQIYLYTEGITAAWLGLGKLISALLIRKSIAGRGPHYGWARSLFDPLLACVMV